MFHALLRKILRIYSIMLIEIRGTGFKNKGAELMLRTIMENMSAEFCLEPSRREGSQPYENYAKLGLYPTSRIYRRGFNFGFFWKFFPRVIKQLYGIKDLRDVSIVLDASGYSYSDSWGSSRLKELRDRIRSCRKYGTKFIFMPQAFGAFSGDNAEIMKWCVDNSFLTFCRDSQSAVELGAIGVDPKKIIISPDFTALISSSKGQSELDNGRILVVPNYRMIDKGGFSDYVDRLVLLINKLAIKGVACDLMVHEGKRDEELANQIASACNHNVEIICPTNGIDAKGVISKYQLVVSGRYHASISALSSGVPCLSTSWSHKYKYMHSDFGFPEGLIEKIDDLDDKYVLNFLSPESQSDVRKKLLLASKRVANKNHELFSILRGLEQ